MDIELLIQNGNTIYYPSVEEDIEIVTERQGAPGQMKISVLIDGTLDITEGNAVRFKKGDEGGFYGFIFTKKRNKELKWDITVYDQLRYFKNKDTYVYENKTADEVLKMLIKDFQLNAGNIASTGFKIASRVEDNTSLFDIMGNALDLTLQNKKEMFVMYDNFGKIDLQNIADMVVPILIDEETGENFDYTSSIDSNTYNKIKLTFDNEKTGKRDVYIAQDGTNINEWGVLQYFDTLSEGENGKAKADALLSLYNQKTRTLSITDAFGDMRVRAGCMVVVRLDLGDIKVENLMLVEKCKHKFSQGIHTMSMNLRGGTFTV